MDEQKMFIDKLGEFRRAEARYRRRTRRIYLWVAFRFLALVAFVTAVGLIAFAALDARAEYRPRFVERSLNKTIVIVNGRASTISGGAGTQYLFKENTREYYRGPSSCVVPYRRFDSERSHLRRTRDCTPDVR